MSTFSFLIVWILPGDKEITRLCVELSTTILCDVMFEIYIYIYIVAKSIYFWRSSNVHWTNINTLWSKTSAISTAIIEYFPGYGQIQWKHFVKLHDKEIQDTKVTKFKTCFFDINIMISHLALLLFRSAWDHHQGIKPK